MSQVRVLHRPQNMKVQPIRTRIFKRQEDLVNFVGAHLKKMPERSVLVVSSKIVALSEGRAVQPLEESQKERLIKKESSWAQSAGNVWLTEKNGMIMANAGIDESNANGELVLLPKNSYQSAEALRTALRKKYKIKNLGVVIADSAIMPLRAGVVGAALGYAGFMGIRDYRGKKDLFGRTLIMSRTNVADSIATAAILVMGEGAESQPLALMTDAPVEFKEKINKKETHINPKDDIFWPVLKGVRHTK
ncbi:MAG: coenzyme F420-0:L-glutamate ligase [Patescibacteria group bacterium]